MVKDLKDYEENIPNLRCSNCKFYRANADKSESLCKRLDHKVISFYYPYFKSGGIDGLYICSDFEPGDSQLWLKEHWQGFEHWKELYKESWDYSNSVPLIINGNREVIYRVSRDDFEYNTFLQGNVLKAFRKTYMKGRTLVHEDVDGVLIEGIKHE